VFILSLCVNEQ